MKNKINIHKNIKTMRIFCWMNIKKISKDNNKKSKE